MAQRPSSTEQNLKKPVHDRRREIILGIKGIQPVVGKNLRDVEIPQRLYSLAKVVAEEETIDNRFKKVDVYKLLLDHIRVKGEQGSVDPSQVEATLAGWQQASKALFRYALNLVLAPKRPEFKKMKLSSSFYVYNISRNLHGAQEVFVVMGYQLVERQGKGGQDLVYEGDVKPAPVLETATDLLVMHEEIGLIRELVAGGRGGYMTLEQAIMQRWQTNPAHDTRSAHDTWSAGVHPQPQPQMQLQPQSRPGHLLNPQGGSAYCFTDDGRTSGGIPPQPHSQTYGQPPQPVTSSRSQPSTALGHHGTSGYERGGLFAQIPLDPSMTAAQQQQPAAPFNLDHEKLHHHIVARASARQSGSSYENAAQTARGGDRQQYAAEQQQQQYATGHDGYSTGGGPNPLPQTHAQQWQDVPYLQGAREPQRVDPYPSQVPPAPVSAPVTLPQPPPDATFYQNVHYQNAGSESAIYQNASDVLQMEANSEVNNLESTTVTQEVRKLYQQYPSLAGRPPLQKGTQLPVLEDDTLDIYSDDTQSVPVDSQPVLGEAQSVPPTQEEPYSFDLPAPMVHFSASTPASTPASEFYSGITSSLVHSRSSGDGRLSPVDEQPQGLGDRVNDPEYQQQLQQQQLSDTEYQQQLPHDYSRGRSTSTDSKESSIDIYGSPQGEVFRRQLSRNRSSSTDSKESSLDICTSGRGDKLGKYALDPLHEEPVHLSSDPAPTHHSPLPRGTAHPLETNTQHPMNRPALQLQGSQDDTARPIVADTEVSKKPVPLPRAALKQQVKSHSVDEVEPDSEGRRMKRREMRTSASGSDLLQHERHSQSSEPSSPRRLDPPTPRPRRSRSPSPSPRSSAENSPSTSPTPPRRKVPPIPEHPSQPPGHQLGVGMPPKAQSVDNETQRRKDIREKNPVERLSSGNLEAAAAAFVQTSQASPPLRTVPGSPHTQKSSHNLPPNAPVMGIPIHAAAAAAKRKQRDDSASTDQLPPGQLPYGQPLSGQPSSGQPSSGQPSYGQPSSGQPSFGQPSYGQPSSGQPSFGQPSSNQLLSGQRSSGQLSFDQPSSGLPLSGQPPSQLPPNHPSQPPPGPHVPSWEPGQPSQGQQPIQPWSGQSPGQLQQPLQSHPQSQPLHNQQRTSQPSSDEPGQPLNQQLQRRTPPNELPTSHAQPDRNTLSPPGQLKAAPSLSTSTVAAKTVDTSESDQSDLDQHRPNRQSIESLEKNLGQDTSKVRRQEHVKQPAGRKRSNAVSESSNPYSKSTEFNTSAEDELKGGSDDTATTADVEQLKYSLGDTWTCPYCTNLVQVTLPACDVCGRNRETTV